MLRARVIVVLLLLTSCERADRIPEILATRLGSLGDPTPIDFYQRAGHRLVWCDGSGALLPRATMVLEALRRAGEHGLRPEHYDTARLGALAAEIGAGGRGDAELARQVEFDLLLSAAFLRYASDVSTGRIHPHEIDQDWHTNPPELDFVEALVQNLERDDLAELLAALPPPHAGYTRLRQALAELRQVEPPGSERIQEVELNLERWRWIPRRLGDAYVLVNIPGFDLEYVRDGATVWRTRVVTGKSYTPTPVFSDRIVAVVANPPWNVPDSIAVGEYLPELRQDPKALSRHRLRLFESAGENLRELDPTKVDWSEVDGEHFPYRLRQDPGPENALGRLKFDLTNDFRIYLHDTPAGHLFSREERDLSHGCIRVEHPFDLAAQLFDASSQKALRDALAQPEERRLAVKPPVPIHILYWTAWVGESGALTFGPDVYELNAAQRAALERAATAGQTARGVLSSPEHAAATSFPLDGASAPDAGATRGGSGR